MAITTYAELQAAAANWLVRSDLTARVPEFIALGEARLNRILRKRQAEVDQSLAGVPGSRFIPLPAAYTEALNLWIVRSTGREQVQRFIDPALIETTSTAGEPVYWTIDGTNLAFDRPCDQAYSFTLRMIGKFALSDTAPTNALLSEAPDVYLFATLAEAGPFLRDGDLTAAYEAKLLNAVQQLNAKDARSRAPQTLSTEPALLTSWRNRGYDVTRDR